MLIQGSGCIEVRIKELLEQLGMSLSELARQTGMGKGTLSELKNGQKRTLSRDHEIKLAKAFGVEVSELYKEDLDEEYLKPRRF